MTEVSTSLAADFHYFYISKFSTQNSLVHSYLIVHILIDQFMFRQFDVVLHVAIQLLVVVF